MPSIADLLLGSGCAVQIERAHGETIRILGGVDAGKVFVGVREVEQDVVLSSDLGEDPRAKRIVRFVEGRVPTLNSQDRVQTDDGKVWKTIRRPDSGFLTVDFELVEVTTKDT